MESIDSGIGEIVTESATQHPGEGVDESAVFFRKPYGHSYVSRESIGLDGSDDDALPQELFENIHTVTDFYQQKIRLSGDIGNAQLIQAIIKKLQALGVHLAGPLNVVFVVQGGQGRRQCQSVDVEGLSKLLDRSDAF